MSQKIYFKFPSWQGDVYQTAAIDSSSFVAVLPNGKAVKLVCKDGFVMHVRELSTKEALAANQEVCALILRADLVFGRAEAVQEWRGDWNDRLIEMIEAAAAVNTLFVVHLPRDEYEKLRTGGLENLQKRFSEGAVSRMKLSEDSVIDFRGHALDILRFGSCPR